MVEVPSSLRCVFSATVRERDGTYVVEIPQREVDLDTVAPGETYRVAVLGPPAEAESAGREDLQSDRSPSDQHRRPDPPVDEGEVREVTIETVGDQGDGIAKVERGYVVIVPGAEPGDVPTVEIDQVRENVAFATVVEDDSRAR